MIRKTGNLVEIKDKNHYNIKHNKTNNILI